MSTSSGGLIQRRHEPEIPQFPLPEISLRPNFSRLLYEPKIPKASLKEITLTYYRSLTSYNISKKDLCTACYEPEEPTTTNFCSQHAFHFPCLVNQVYGCSQGLIEKIKILRSNHIKSHTLGFLASLKTYSHSTYTLTIPEENLPTCPNCRRTEGITRLEATVVDRQQGPLKTKVGIEKSHESSLLGLKIFDRLTAVLTIFEAFLSYVQNSTPALAGRIFVVQRLLLIADVAIVARNCFLLNSLITQRPATIDTDTGKSVFAKTAVVGLATVVAVYFINRYFKSAIDPQEFLKNIPISDLGSVSCKWVAIPLTQQISQFVIASRFASELALACLSKERLRHLSHTILQIFTLFNVSQLQWLDFARTILNPLETIPFTIQNSSSKSDIEFYQKTIEKASTNFTMLVPANTSVSDVQAMISSVYEYSSSLFKNSVWDGYAKGNLWSVSKVIYTIQLASSLLEFPYIEGISMLITTYLERRGVFTTIPTLIFRQ